MAVVYGGYGAASQPARRATAFGLGNGGRLRVQHRWVGVDWRAAILSTLLQCLQQVDPFLALQLQLAQRLDKGSLGRGRGPDKRRAAVGIVVGDVVQCCSPGTQGFLFVAFRFEVDGGRAGEEGLVVGLLCRAGPHRLHRAGFLCRRVGLVLRLCMCGAVARAGGGLVT